MKRQKKKSVVFAWLLGLTLLGDGWAEAVPQLTAGNGEIRWVSVPLVATNEVSGMNGRLIKQGEGVLTLAATTNTQGSGTVEIRKGAVAYEAQSLAQVAFPQAALSQACFWVAADTNVVMTTADGTNSVIEWRDVRELSTSSPYTRTRAIRMYGAQSPVYGTDGQLPYIDFGRFGDSDNNRWLLWADSDGNRVAVSNIIQVFAVFACPVSYGLIFGDWTGTEHGGNNTFIAGNTSVRYSTLFAYFAGTIYLDNVSATLGQAGTFPKRDYQLLEAIASAPTTASNFCNDRNFHAGDVAGVPINRQGGVRLCEVLVFTNALSSADRAGVNAYLAQKWFATRPELLAVGSGRVAVNVADGVTSGTGISGSGEFRKTGAGTLIRLNASNRNGTLTYLDEGTVREGLSGSVRRNDSPLLALESGGQTLNADGTNVVRASGGQTDTVVKTGEGALTVGAISNGVKKVRVSCGRLKLSPPMADMFAYEADMTNESFEIHGTLLNNGAWSRLTASVNGWIFIEAPSWPGNGAGLAYDTGVDSPFITSGNVPDGKSVAFIERDGAIKTSVVFPQAGNYTVHFKAAARADGNGKGDFRVAMGNCTSDLMTATFFGSGRSAVRFCNHQYTACLQRPGVYDLVFQSVTNPAYTGNGYTCVTLDDIHIEQEHGEGDILNGAGSFATVVALDRTSAGYTGQYAIAPTNTTWTFSAVTNGTGGYLSASGISAWPTPYTSQPICEGWQCAWILANGSIERSVAYPISGGYRLSFYAGGGDTSAGTLIVSNDGDRIGEFSLAAKTFKPYSFVLPFVAAAGEAHTLRFQGGSSGIASIDSVRIERLPCWNIVSNCSFETGIALATNGVSTAPTGTGWTFAGSAGIAGYASGYGNSASGSREAFILNNGSIWQEIIFSSAGVYGVSFKAAAPSPLVAASNGYGALHQLAVDFVKAGATDTNTLGVIETRADQYTEYTFRLPYVKAGIPYLLRFAGIAQDGDRASVLDDVTLFSLETGTVTNRYPKDLELALTEGTKLDLDFSGMITLGALNYGKRVCSGLIIADAAHPFVSGDGTVYVAPRGTMISVR